MFLFVCDSDDKNEDLNDSSYRVFLVKKILVGALKYFWGILTRFGRLGFSRKNALKWPIMTPGCVLIVVKNRNCIKLNKIWAYISDVHLDLINSRLYFGL